MKKSILCILSVLVMLFCLPMLGASAAEKELPVGINGKQVDMTEGYASGYGWEMVYNRRDEMYTLTLTKGNFDIITAYCDLCVNIPAGASVTIGKDTGSYALGVQNGTLTLNGTGNLSLIGQNGLISLNGDIIVNGPTISASATNRAVFCSGGSLTINGGAINATGVNAGVETTKGLYVNGGTLRASATATTDTAAGLKINDCYFKMAGGSVTLNGTNAISALQSNISVSGGTLTAYGNSYGVYTGPTSANSTASGKTVMQIADGTCLFAGAKTGVYLCNNSAFKMTGGSVECKVTVGTDTSNTCGLQIDKSDLHISGGVLKTSGYQGISVNGLSASADRGDCKALEVSGGFVSAIGTDAGLRCYDASALMTGGVINASATGKSGVYLYYADLQMRDGTLIADGGSYGINSHQAHPVITGGQIIADGDNYGFFCVGQITIENGSVTAIGGNTGLVASNHLLTVGTSAASRASLTAIGGSFAISGQSVMLFGRTYDYATALNYKMLCFVDGAESYRSDSACSLKINGSPVDIAADMNASGVNVSYNEGGSAANYKWMLQKSVNGRYTLTLNGATLAGMEVTGAVDIVLREAASSLTGEWKMTNAYVRLNGNASSLSVTNSGGNAINMLNSVLVHNGGTLDLRSPMYAYVSDFIGMGIVYGNHRNDMVSLASSDAVLLGATAQNTDSSALFALNNSSLQAYGSDFIANGVTGTAFNAADSRLFFEKCEITTNGGAGITAKQLTATDSELSVTGCIGRGIAVGADGVTFDNCTVNIAAQEEALFTQGDANFISTNLRADSADGVKAVLLSAAPDSLARISVSGHCLIKSGKEPVRFADANGVASYFANEDVALSSVFISNEHNYSQSAAYIYCNTVGTAVMSCTYTDCTCTLTKVMPEIAHDFSNYVPNGDATCSSDGTKTATCPICFAKNTVLDIDSKTDHTFVDYKTNSDAECLIDGTKTAKCEYCDATDKQPDIGSALGHDYEVVVVSGDCENNVWTKMVCKRCDVETEPQDTGSLGDHKWDETRECTEIRYCSVCNQTDGKLLLHKYSEFTADSNATCTTAGTLSATCVRCGEKQILTDPDAPATGHDPKGWITIIEPTAYSTGTKALLCNKCPMQIETQVLAITVVPVAQAGIRVDYENGFITLEQTGLTIGTIRGMLDNSDNVIAMTAIGVRLEDETLAQTGTGIKVTNNGRLFKLVVIGDLDGNGMSDSGDARLALRISVGLDSADPEKVCAGDTDGNGQLTAGDARTLLRRSVGLE
ncbi:MAG: hypothetical protein E7523_04210 [Ruminococcaceae bacterium]|nr:hypothetical protein [Oscillospiraceae bacterium]